MISNKRKFQKRSLTLVEVLIAAIIATTALLAVYSSMMAARSASLAARLHNAAQEVAMDKVLELNSLSYSRLRRFALENTAVINEELPVQTIASDELGDSLPYGANLNQFNGVLRYAVFMHPNSCEIVARVEWVMTGTDGSPIALATDASMLKYNLD